MPLEPNSDRSPSASVSGVHAPAISLPQGGGAIRGIGEKFSANPVTGTGSMAVPITTSAGRSGFGPQISLSYDSGAGNSPFGFGWTLALPSITRKTDKGLPQYAGFQDSDVVILSGAEELVPVYRQDRAGAWVRDAHGALVIDEEDINGYRVRRYRSRVEGLFARIERWTFLDDPREVHWRSISKNNIHMLERQVGSHAFFAKVILSISQSTDNADLAINIDPAVDPRWHSAVSFGIEYAWAQLDRERLRMPSVLARVTSVEWQPADSTKMTVAFASANAMWETLKHRPDRMPTFDASAGWFIFPN